MKESNRNLERRDFLKVAGGGLLSLALGSKLHAQTGSPAKRPNLVFFFTDQQSFDMLGCNGNTQILTPHADAFSRTALSFNHCISNNPVCTPTRGVLLSGQHSLYNGAFTNDVQLRPQNGTTIGEVLAKEGYATSYIGKWHLYGGDRNRPIPPGPQRHGFETFLSNNCTLNFMPGQAFYYDDTGQKVKFSEWEGYGQTRQAVNFIQNQKADKPFALFLSLHPPHDQGLGRGGLRYRSIQPLMDRYQPNDIKFRKNASLPVGTAKDDPMLNEEFFWQQLREDYHGYYAMCSGCDDCFGRVTAALQAAGLDDNTIVVYSSDHGDLLHSNGRPWPKSFPESGSCRVPFMIRYPGVLPENQRSDLLLGTLDIMPTLAGLMGLEAPSVWQGVSLADAMRKGSNEGPESIPLFYFLPSWRGVYTSRYTYSIDEFNGKSPLDIQVLYDRETDPEEMNNLFSSSDPLVAPVRDRLHAQTMAWLEKFNDPFLPSEEFLRRMGRTDGNFARPGEDGVLPGRPIDLIHAAAT